MKVSTLLVLFIAIDAFGLGIVVDDELRPYGPKKEPTPTQVELVQCVKSLTEANQAQVRDLRKEVKLGGLVAQYAAQNMRFNNLVKEKLAWSDATLESVVGAPITKEQVEEAMK